MTISLGESMRRIETDRLTLRNFQTSDLQSLIELVEDYNASEYSKYDHEWPRDIAGIEKMLSCFRNGEDFLAVCEKGSGGFIGFVSLNREENERDTVYNLGYVFHSAYHGHGFAYESCRAYIRYAFDELDASRIITGTASGNTESCRLLARLGFVQTGEKKEHLQVDENGNPIEFMAYLYELNH